MHVFIDTNILLNFFHFSNEELDSLNDVFASHENGSAKVYLTEQVRDEFRRNREAKIKDALGKFQDVNKFNAELPSFMKKYNEYEEIKKFSSEIKKRVKSIRLKIDKDIKNSTLAADGIIDNILKNSIIRTRAKDCLEKASLRMAIGNPPGKKGSIGDAINWEILLEVVESGKDLHIISADGDFYSQIYEDLPNPFLSEEWEKKKGSKLFVYRTLSSFMKEHFDGVAFSFDNNKEALIDALSQSGSFASTHDIIGKLESYNYFSLREIQMILEAAKKNGQFGGILGDYDILDFLRRVSIPHMSNIRNEQDIAILNKVIAEQKEREES
jgi:predicted nucleic acid-binding protein